MLVKLHLLNLVKSIMKLQNIITDEAKNSSVKLVNKWDFLLALYGATSVEVAISKIDEAINQAVLKIGILNE